MGYKKFAEDVGIDVGLAKEILEVKYKGSFKQVIAYLDASGKNAQMKLEARTMANSRRLFKKPTWDDAKAKLEVELGRIPTTDEIKKKYKGMYASIEREGKNTPIQGTNAYMIKRAMGCGFDAQGRGYLWHQLHSTELHGKAWLENMVHDELVVETFEPLGEQVKATTGDCMTRAGAEFVKRVVMTWEGKIAPNWSK